MRCWRSGSTVAPAGFAVPGSTGATAGVTTGAVGGGAATAMSEGVGVGAIGGATTTGAGVGALGGGALGVARLGLAAGALVAGVGAGDEPVLNAIASTATRPAPASTGTSHAGRRRSLGGTSKSGSASVRSPRAGRIASVLT